MGQISEMVFTGSREESMKLIDAEKLKNWIKRECNPYGAPTLDFETSEKIMDMIDRMDNENRWILVSERVPETATPVLCSVESTDISEARIHIIGSYHNDCWFLQSSVGLHSFPVMEYKVRAWMPLPKLYIGDSNE